MGYVITSTVKRQPSTGNLLTGLTETIQAPVTGSAASNSPSPVTERDSQNESSEHEMRVKVLLIDDQPIVAESLYRLLADAPDIEFYYCREVQQAIPMAVEVEPTVILQDLVMPDTNGLTLVKFFRANPATQKIPVIVLSTRDDSTTKADAFSSGANDYLVKIPDGIELIARLRYHSAAYTNLIKSQAAEQTLAYNKELERRVAERTAELETALANLKQTQGQLIQDEKMASLGQLIAGVAHEINNPVNFIAGNLRPAKNYAQDLLGLIALYQQEYPEPTEAIQAEIEDLNLEFLAEDFTKLLTSLKMGTDRIHEIVLSLRNFSRVDALEMQQVDIHSGIDSTLLILGSKLKDINVFKTYNQCPEISCFPSQLNQVFMNILANAADALLENAAPEKAAPQIHIQTQLIAENSENNFVQITISDNGPGIPEDTRRKIFDAFFTTKPVGLGTGLGLSISYQIVTERHNGRLTCESMVGEGTSFVIQIPTIQ
ncbi:MAG: ATP-binding protein [Cyanobacteria bacterium J06555_13]